MVLPENAFPHPLRVADQSASVRSPGHFTEKSGIISFPAERRGRIDRHELLERSAIVNNPSLLLINTRPWLRELSARYNRPVTISTVPVEDWERVGVGEHNTIWLMGIHAPSEASRQSAMNYPQDYHQALPDLHLEQDVVGSPFAVAAYEPNPRVANSWKEIDQTVARLNAAGIKVIADFVPNHVAPDHQWVWEHPEFFIQATEAHIANSTRYKDGYFYQQIRQPNGEVRWLANGKDPHYPGWLDTLQLNYANPGLQQAMEQQLLELVDHLDGVRIDMAMLPNPETFLRTWGHFLSTEQHAWLRENPFWPKAIGKAKAKAAQLGKTFELVAEAYWDKQELGQAGIDKLYAKDYYDHVIQVVRGEGPKALLGHMQWLANSSGKPETGDFGHVVFIENHDEERISQRVGLEASLAAAALTAFIPGATFLEHQGQRMGRWKKTPMQVDRFPVEEERPEVAEYYQHLMRFKQSVLFQQGNWSIGEIRQSHPNNDSVAHIVPQQIDMPGRGGAVVCTNTSGDWADGQVRIPDNVDVLVYDLQKGAWLENIGIPDKGRLYVGLESWHTQIVFYTPKVDQGNFYN